MQNHPEVNFVPLPGFKSKFRELRKTNPEILESIKTFNDYKRKIPPKRLPKTMRDHHLVGELAGIRECHLAPDILLLYTHKNHVVTMIKITKHDDI